MSLSALGHAMRHNDPDKAVQIACQLFTETHSTIPLEGCRKYGRDMFRLLTDALSIPVDRLPITELSELAYLLKEGAAGYISANDGSVWGLGLVVPPVTVLPPMHTWIPFFTGKHQPEHVLYLLSMYSATKGRINKLVALHPPLSVLSVKGEPPGDIEAVDREYRRTGKLPPFMALEQHAVGPASVHPGVFWV